MLHPAILILADPKIEITVFATQKTSNQTGLSDKSDNGMYVQVDNYVTDTRDDISENNDNYPTSATIYPT